MYVTNGFAPLYAPNSITRKLRDVYEGTPVIYAGVSKLVSG